MTIPTSPLAAAEALTPKSRRRGVLLILSSPSGAGKTTLSRNLLEVEHGLVMSVSVTTRPRRPNEISGRDYHFIAADAFDRMVAAGELLEHAEVFGHRYGTPRAPVEAVLKRGGDVLFDIDWQGAEQVARAAKEDTVAVFILPPSFAELERRLRHRAQDSDAVVAQRMAKAAEEMSHWADYDYVLINQDVETSLAQLQMILGAERLRRTRQIGLAEFVGALRQGER